MRDYLNIIILSLFLVGCSVTQQQGNVSISNKDSVKILRFSPEETETLKVGSNVKFKFEVEYNLATTDSGRLALVVQGASNERISNEFYVVQKGRGIEILEADIVVPETRAVHVFTPLTPKGSSSTTVVELRRYKVEKLPMRIESLPEKIN